MTYDLNITFDDNLVTGNDTIDTQHKELIDRIRNFVVACQNGDSKVKAIKMLDYLDEYTDFHFKEEEELQEKAGYPERGKHHEKHEEFKKSIQELYEYLQDYEGPTDQFSELVQKNVVDWLFGHIKTFDRSVAEFIFMRENPDRVLKWVSGNASITRSLYFFTTAASSLHQINLYFHRSFFHFLPQQKDCSVRSYGSAWQLFSGLLRNCS